MTSLVFTLEKRKRSKRIPVVKQEYDRFPALLFSEIFSEPKICVFNVFFSLFSSVKQPQQESKTQRGSLFDFPLPFFKVNYGTKRFVVTDSGVPPTTARRTTQTITRKPQTRKGGPSRPYRFKKNVGEDLDDNIETRLNRQMHGFFKSTDRTFGESRPTA